MNRSAVRIIAYLSALIIFAGGIYLYRTGFFDKESRIAESAEEATDASATPAAARNAALPVEAVIARPEVLTDDISVNGSTLPSEEVTITSEVPGKIHRILFREGTYVGKGTPLVQLDTEELEAQRERLLVQQDLNSGIAARMKNLYDREAVSLQEYEIAEAEAEQVKAQLALLEVQIQKRTIKAPFAGTLGLRRVSEGSYISPGMPIVNLVSANPIHIQFSIPEKYSQAIRVGSSITFKLESVEEPIRAAVIATEPKIDPDTRTFQLKASAQNPQGRILPGSFANVTVNLKSYQSAILIPTEAIVSQLEGQTVFLYRDGKADLVPVKTGIRRDVSIQILEGIQEGDTVITSGILQMRPGAPVRISDLKSTSVQ
ncbi:MAG: efflux RND transporter periplasmic adaptor subunit [Saprospiraceae bacterium]|nr:efflux RND transporter periplasmic adaptor subunit [Saprospiraceae bacterium]